MRSVLVLLEDLVRAEFGAADLASVRAIATSRLGAVGIGSGPAGRVSAFVSAISDVRRRPLPEVYTFVGMRLVAAVLRDEPTITRDRPSTRQVLLQLDHVAPWILDMLVPGAHVPSFDVELLDVESLRVSCTGVEPVAWLLDGVLRGLGQHFGERVEVRHVPPPSHAPERRVCDVTITPERRLKAAMLPPGGDRRRHFPV